MPCFHPLTAWQAPPGLDFRNKGDLSFTDPGDPRCKVLRIPCGQCIGCRLERSRQWAIRCLHESQLHDENCFLTLTYNEENLPDDLSLRPEDITKFLKRLRRSIEPRKIRFLQCGEYGSINYRPHHHCLIFGYDFPDKEIFGTSVAGYIYRSPLLEKLWPFGFSSIGDVTFESSAYVARYILKKVTGDPADDHYHGRVPEYITMSRRPGIASKWFDIYGKSVYDKDFITINDGIKCRPPKFYDKLYERNHGYENLKSIKESRLKEILSPAYQANCTDERLSAREEHQSILNKLLVRNI